MTAERTSASDAEAQLRAYLNEHLLGSEGGLRAFRAAAHTWAGTRHEATLLAIGDDIARDRRDLARIVRAVGQRPAAWKRLLTGAVSAVGHLAPYNLLRRRGSSMAQLELDILTGAVRAKRSMWDALLVVAESDARLDRALLDDLRDRADAQIAALQRLSLETVEERFVAGTRQAAHRDDPRPASSDERSGDGRSGDGLR